MPIKFPATIELKIKSVPENFQLNFKICHNPDCDCAGVSMVLYNERKEIQLFFDFGIESYRENNYSEEDIKILNSLIDFLKSQENEKLNLGFFKKQYVYVKEKVKRRRDAIESYELGTFLLYGDVLWGEEIKIRINKYYVIFDSYCVMPNCDCTEVALNFFENIYKLGMREPDFSFVYNYVTGVCRNPAEISEEEIKNIISIIPDPINNKFKRRHAKLKKEVKNDIEKKIKGKKFVPNNPQKRKLGRNEPCHCDSGKKYKKCCLDKDIENYGKAIKVSYR